MKQKALSKCLAALGLVASGILLGLPAPVQAADNCIQPPVSCRISSKFGWRLHPVKKVQKLHRGTDFACPVGTTVNSAHNGSVAFAGTDYGGGNVVKLRAGNIETKYMHNHRLIARIGDSVSAGKEVAKSGNTGAWTTGPHLHFELWVGGQPKDPMAAMCGSGSLGDAGTIPPPPEGAEGSGGSNGSGGSGDSSGSGVPRFDWEVRDGLEGSFWDMLGGLISSRALNPDYARQVGLLDETRLYEEFNYLRGVKSRVTFERLQARQRIARNQALINAIRAEARHAKGLDAQRAAAMQSAANR